MMTNEEKKQLNKYRDNLNKEAKKFKFTGDDLTNMYDLFYMVDFGTLKLNGLNEWACNMFDRLEPIVIPELFEEKKK